MRQKQIKPVKAWAAINAGQYIFDVRCSRKAMIKEMDKFGNWRSRGCKVASVLITPIAKRRAKK